jgi:hypothetical protein
MAHFARIEDDLVTDVIVVGNEYESTYAESRKQYGEDWVQTSYNGNFRGVFAGIGFAYNLEEDIFITKQPWPSWIRNGSFWDAPVPHPTDDKRYIWNEEILNWELVIETAS